MSKPKDREQEEILIVEEPINNSGSTPVRVQHQPHGHKYESLDIQSTMSKAYRQMPHGMKYTFFAWMLFVTMGMSMGVIAFIMDQIEEYSTKYKWEASQEFLNENEVIISVVIFIIISVVLVAIAAGMTVFWGPGAAGSGLAETMAFMNGINYPKFIGINTLVTKIFGVVFAVAGGLKIGKEGPLAHIGSLMGIVMIYVPWGFSKNFRNDRDKRLLVASGAGVGVAVAFGAPIGGTMFAYEVAKMTPFWSFSLCWRTFLATSLSNFTLSIMIAIKDGKAIDIINAGLIKFGKADLQLKNYELKDIPLFIVIGSLGGKFHTSNPNRYFRSFIRLSQH